MQHCPSVTSECFNLNLSVPSAFCLTPPRDQCPVSALLHTRLTSECWKMGAKANLQTGSSEDINEVTGGPRTGPCTRPWPWSVPAVPCNKCNRLDSYCQHWRFCLGKVAACSSLLLGAKLLQLPVFSRDMNHEPAISTKTCAPFSLQQSRPCSAGQSPAPGRGRVQGWAAATFFNCKILQMGFTTSCSAISI